MSKTAFAKEHLTRLRSLKYVSGWRSKACRYGYGLHELRDLGRGILENAKADGFNTLRAEYWMGHTVDALFYNKIWGLDPEYNPTQYRIAEKYLNVVSKSPVELLSDEEMVNRIIRDPGMEKLVAVMAR